MKGQEYVLHFRVAILPFRALQSTLSLVVRALQGHLCSNTAFGGSVFKPFSGPCRHLSKADATFGAKRKEAGFSVQCGSQTHVLVAENAKDAQVGSGI